MSTSLNSCKHTVLILFENIVVDALRANYGVINCTDEERGYCNGWDLVYTRALVVVIFWAFIIVDFHRKIQVEISNCLTSLDCLLEINTMLI